MADGHLYENDTHPPHRIRTKGHLVLMCDLFERWTGATEEEVLELEASGLLRPFWVEKSLKVPPRGNLEHWLRATKIETHETARGPHIVDVSSVFLESNIIEIEKQRPDFLLPQVRWHEAMRPYGWGKGEIGMEQGEDEEQTALSAMEAELAQERAANEKLRLRVAELESMVQRGGEGAQEAEDFPEEYEGHGIFTVVAKLVDARAPVPEIMAAIDNEQVFLSQREVGYFFHPSPQGKKKSTLQNYTKRKKARD